MKRPHAAPRLRFADLRRPPPQASWRTLPHAHRVRSAHSGRAALYQYLWHLRRTLEGSRRSRVLVPAFHCPTVVDPVVHAGYDVCFYAIQPSLRVDVSDFTAKLREDVAAAVFIQYFGISEPETDLFARCREAGVRVIDDRCHSFIETNPLRLAGVEADAAIYSFWKLVPSLAGGGVILNQTHEEGAWPDLTAPSVADSWSRAKDLARHLAAEFQLLSRVRDAVKPPVPEPIVPAIRKMAVEAYPYAEVAASWRMPLTARLILASADLAGIASARRRNFQVFAMRLMQSEELTPVCRDLPLDACPWGFPIYLRRRPERDYLLRAQGVPVFTFAEILHPLLLERHRREKAMIEAAQYLSNTLLVFAIHQGLQAGEIEAFAAISNEFTASLRP